MTEIEVDADIAGIGVSIQYRSLQVETNQSHIGFGGLLLGSTGNMYNNPRGVFG